MADPQTVIEGTLKYRDSKKWKPRWCVIRKLSPVADCLHLQLYRDSKDRCKNGPTKASLSLEGFLGMETGFTLDKESNTMAIICSEVVVVLAFDSRELLIQWQVKVRANLVEEHQFLVQIAHAPPRSKLASGPARLHLLDYMFCLTAGVPPKMLGIWPLKELRRFGVVDGKFCFEGGSKCGKGEGLHVLLTNQAKDLVQAFDMASRGRLPGKRKIPIRKTTGGDDSKSPFQSRIPGCCTSDGSEKIPATCSLESSTKQLLNSGSDANDGTTAKTDDSHIRPCHMHYRWPSCIVPCGAAATRDILCDEGQHRSLAKTSHGQMFWAMGHCTGCGLHYTRRGSNDKEKAPVPPPDDNTGFTPQWTMDLAVVSPSKDGARTVHRNRGGKAPHDRSSLCSQSSESSGTSTGSHTSSSSSSSISEYSVPKNCMEGFYDRPKNIHHVHQNPAYNRLSGGEDMTANKAEVTTPCGVRNNSNLGPIQESSNVPPCTCWYQKPPGVQIPQDVVVSSEMCPCWNRSKRNSVDVDMPSFSSSGSSNASPSTSPKKHQPFVGVPILLPCTCGKSNNPYLNYAVPRSSAPVKDAKQNELNNQTIPRNITESETETKIINKVDNSSSYSLNEDNGNKLSSVNIPKISETMTKAPPIQPTQFCPCQKLLFCPSGFLPSWNRSLMPVRGDRQQRSNNPSLAEYATVSKKAEVNPLSDTKCGTSENEPQDQNLNARFAQRHIVCSSSLNCCGGRMAFGVPVVNSWKKDNANHIYVNLKYLQEQAAAAARNQGAPQKMIPYYANLYFLQTLSLYENSGQLAIRPLNLFSATEGTEKTDSTKKPFPKKRLEPPSNNPVYEMMSFNRQSPSAGSENYMLMQPGTFEEAENQSSSEKPAEPAASSDSASAEPMQSSNDGSSFEESSLPLRPFMPVLLPFHEHIYPHKDNSERKESVSSNSINKKHCGSDDECRSSRSNSLGDLKMTILRRGRSSSSDSRQCGEIKPREDCSGSASCCSPKSTPIRKHSLLTKLTFKSKEKSFSTDEITPPSTAPPSPDSMFLESIQKYPFHRSADCLQLNEEYRLSEEDLSQDPEVIMSESMNKGRSTHSIKRSSSVPCKANPHQQQQHSNTSGEQCGPSLGQAAVFSHFIAYHGSLPRRCSGNAASRHALIDRKVSSAGNHEHSNAQEVPQKSADTSNMIYISECKQCHQFVTSPEGMLVLDAKSMTSSSSSDMSDYIESLSLCSRSSSGSSGVGGGSGDYVRAEELTNSKGPSCTSSLRPRSGKEYHSFDRIIFQDGCPCIPVADCTHLTLPCLRPFVEDITQAEQPSHHDLSTGDKKTFKASSSNRMNSPSPGYVSSSPGNADFISPEKTTHHFVFPKETKDLNYLEVMSIGESEPTSPVVKSNTVQYAVIDMVATAAAEKLGLERAQMRDGPTPLSKSTPKHTAEDKEV